MTIQTIVNIAKLSQPYCLLDITKKGLFGGGVDLLLPRKIYTVRKDVNWLLDLEGLTDEVKAVGTVTIDAIGNNGDIIQIKVLDPVLGLITVVEYTKTSYDSSTTILAEDIVITFNLYFAQYGYVLTSVNNVIYVLARQGVGAAINGGNNLQVVITAATNPIPLTDLWGWYDAAEGVTGTTSVSLWADKSGNGNDLVQATSNRQPRQLSSVINSLPVIALKSGSGTQARMSTSNSFPFVDEATIFIVASQNSIVGNTDTNGVYLEYSFGSGLNRYGSGAEIENTLNYDSVGVESVTNDVFYTIMIKTNGIYSDMYINGTQVSHGSTGVTVTQQALYIFQNSFNANTGNKQFAEIIAYNRILDNTEITQVTDYLRNKYNHY